MIGVFLAIGLGLSDLAQAPDDAISALLAILAAVCTVAAVMLGLVSTARVLFATEPDVEDVPECPEAELDAAVKLLSTEAGEAQASRTSSASPRSGSTDISA